ncbi:FRG domain-containing protein [Rhizobium bangladeshense]|uniref:FRG domain-containing protein n=1 Tax=Rhizobium bangladeshense TaxID=1138189 RepID=UPI001C92A902|nr:FRG domain-containing protein [Rhizobium bangladeshense]MBY3597877.1 FRG domain-containing protein [Rhizobium bangladeshense]
MNSKTANVWATLGAGSDTKKPTTVRTPIHSVEEFVAFIAENSNPWTETVYRGQENQAWGTVASIFRQKGNYLPYEHDMARDLMAYHPQEFQQDATMFDRLVRMQHYGLPTRLVDVTLNPLVALYFACENHKVDGRETDGSVIAYHVPGDRSRYYDSNTVALLANLANLSDEYKKQLRNSADSDFEIFNDTDAARRLVRFVRHEKPHFENSINAQDLFRPLYVRPRLSNKRIIAQSGAFIIYGLPTASSGKRYERTIKQLIVNIPAENKGSIRDQLNRFAINANTLFPEIDKAASVIKAKYNNKAFFDLDL